MKTERILILGAGFSGVSIAYFLVKLGLHKRCRLEVHEKSAHVGGLIGSRVFSRPEFGVMETAANGVFKSNLFTDVCADIDCPLITTGPKAKKRFIFWSGRPQRFPHGIIGAIGLFGFVVKLVFRKSSLMPREFETTQKWGERAFGKQATDRLLASGLQGIYAGSIERMSASLILSRFFGLKKKSQLTSAKETSVRGTWSPRLGMGDFFIKMRVFLERAGVEFHLNSDIAATLSTMDFSREKLILAVGGRDAGRILSTLTDAGARGPEQRQMNEWAGRLAQIETAPLISATLIFARPDGDHGNAVSGFGCLFPPSLKSEALGVLFNHDVFPERFDGKVESQTWILGGASQDPNQLINRSDAEIVQKILEFRTQYLHQSDLPIEYHVAKWPQALPHYTVELEQMLKARPSLPHGVYLTGNYLGQIGLAQILERNVLLAEEVSKGMAQ